MALTQGKTSVVQAFVQTCRPFKSNCSKILKNLSSSKVLWLLFLKRLLKSTMSEFYLRWMLYPVFACSRPQCFFFGKLACACEKHRRKKRLYNLVFKIKIRSLINLMMILLGTNVSYWRNSHVLVFLDRSS